MSVESITRHPEHDREDRRRIRNAIAVSIGFHIAGVAVLLISPPIVFHPPPRSITVELFEMSEPLAPAAPLPSVGPKLRPGAPAGSRPAARRKLAPTRPSPAAEPAAELPLPEPQPEPTADPLPPVQKLPAPVLPEEPSKPANNVQPEPMEAKPQDARETALPPTSSTAAVRESMHGVGVSTSNPDDVESGGDALEDPLGNGGAGESLAAASPTRVERRRADPPVRGEARAGASINAEDAAWGRAVRPRIRSKWRALSKYHGREIVMVMSVEVGSAGELIGDPQVLRTSGDRRFDRDVVRGALAASPLPTPPHPGKLIVIFGSEE